ncbi:cobalamin biosynthesis protein [Prosthecomicrobium hirschii]|uniref:cobalamin biosynthesis protein n=1 Tax=Prosthecodimorpha hirschii TaxID=665126 RepID=UPI00112EBE25|nr:cobalamin biosynthesis protein [Prosthecomicrobium hirschii]MCW1841495.1 cobalamin biosynthesis protein [Prosthecomicrobium hirschii]TPQ52405.1 cobalamin biosynthesis protein CobE [Prosthecomicrobium hirschii]
MNRRGARLAVGIGCRTGVAGPAAAALIERALAAARALPEAAGFAPGAAVFTAVEKRAETGLVEAASRLGLALVFLPRNALEAVSDGTVTRSERVVQLFGVPSIAETAALAGAGPGARLIVPRMASDGITCAVAVADGRTG